MNLNVPKQIGDYNKNKMLSILRERGSTSRVELSRLLGISPTAITRNTTPLLKNGIIRECGAEFSSIGRKPVLMELCGDFCYVLGVDIVGGTVKAALANLMGEIVKYEEEPIRREKGAQTVLEQLLTLLRSIIREAAVPTEKIWAVTVGVPGIFDPDTGKSQFTFFLEDWEDIDIRAKVSEALGIETLIENDVNLDIIGESWKGVGKDYEDILYVKLGQGLASRIVLENKLLRGKNKMAGEIGYMSPGVLPNEPQGAKLPNEPQSGAVSAEMNYENMLCNDAISGMYQELTGKTDTNTISGIYTLAQSGDQAAGSVIHYLLDHLAVVLLNSVSVLDPQVIILGGDACRFGEHEISLLKRRMEKYLPLVHNIVPSTLNKQACLFGAIKAGLDRVEERITDVW